MNKREYLTVSALVKYIKHKLETDENLRQVYLRGEISNLVKHSRGHLYFSLKDENSQIRAVMFSSAASRLPFTPKDGDKVLVYGTIDLYIPSGQYSLNIWQMEPDGIGALYLAYEKLKAELEKKGYFAQERKKPIPSYPQTIGVITSPTGAAIRDIIQTIGRRYPLAKVILYPALVQGEEAKNSIKNQIEKANFDGLAELLIVGRGGGSIEDLWAFNELPVIEAIINSKIPIITGIGHETDFTISDFVSDLRAPTPTGAAELATPDIKNLVVQINTLFDLLKRNIKSYFSEKQTNLVYLEERLMNQKPTIKIKEAFNKYEKNLADLRKNYRHYLESKAYQLKNISTLFKRINLQEKVFEKQKQLQQINRDLRGNYKNIFNEKNQQLKLLISSLNYQNPLKLMSQGYSITQIDKRRISSIEEVEINQEIKTILKDGKIVSKVIKKEDII